MEIIGNRRKKQFYWSLLLKNELENQKFATFGGSLDSFGTKYEKKIVWTYSKEDRVDYAKGMEQSIRIKEHSKSQLILEWNFGVFKSPKNPTKFLTDFCLRGHTLITLANKGTYLVFKMLTTVL